MHQTLVLPKPPPQYQYNTADAVTCRQTAADYTFYVFPNQTHVAQRKVRNSIRTYMADSMQLAKHMPCSSVRNATE